MNDAQIWTVIGLFATVMATLVTMTLRIVKVEIADLGHQISGHIDGLQSRLDAKIDTAEGRLNAKIDTVEGRLNAKIDGLDRDVHTLFQRFTDRDA